MEDLLDDVRDACAWVSGRARCVQVRGRAVPSYARTLGVLERAAPRVQAPAAAEREFRAALWLTLDAVNFGSGWFPTLRKTPGCSGYDTIAGGIQRRFADSGPWSPAELMRVTAAELAHALGQDPEHELMSHFARSLSDLGAHVADEHAGSFAAVTDAADGRAVVLVEILAGWKSFADTSTYAGRRVPFLKRAQIAAADLARAGVIGAPDLARLTMFADNLVPHVLRLDGILQFSPELVQRIERGDLIEHGSAEEVEIRACAVHAVELIVAARPDACAAQIDELLWNRGREPRYKSEPRHRSRTTAY